MFVDGVSRGNTPARLSLPPGSHILELRGRGVPRVVPITVTAGADVSQYLELPETPSTGSLLIQSDPAGANVSVDGVAHGVAPVSVSDLRARRPRGRAAGGRRRARFVSASSFRRA